MSKAPLSTKEFLTLMRDFLEVIRERINFLHPSHVEHVFDLMLERYQQWLQEREDYESPDTAEIVELTTKENHDE